MRGDTQVILTETKQLLENKVLNAALEAMERKAIADIDAFDKGQPEVLHKALALVLTLQETRKVRRNLVLTLEGAKFQQEITNE